MFYDSASLSSVLPMSSAMQYPDPLPNDFIVALLELCPKKTCTCFGCRKDLRTFKANKMKIAVDWLLFRKHFDLLKETQTEL